MNRILKLNDGVTNRQGYGWDRYTLPPCVIKKSYRQENRNTLVDSER